jgi:spermidine synthase
VIRVERNFFGLLRVEEVGTEGAGSHALELHDGAVTHGVQFVHPALRSRPTTYFTEWSGAGLLMRLTEDRPRRAVGVVGLGAGTLATYGRSGDRIRFFEINPAVIEVAQQTFTFLEDSAARIEVVPGDARLSLEAEPPATFDILVLDAFSSDAVPVHLLTGEALDLYESRLTADGVLAVHVSNLHLDLSALVHRLVAERDLRPIQVLSRQRLDRGTLLSQWILLTRSDAMERRLIDGIGPLVEAGDVMVFRRKAEDYASLRPWTDDYSNLFQLIR